MARREHEYGNGNILLSVDCMSGFNLWKFIKLSNMRCTFLNVCMSVFLKIKSKVKGKVSC